MELRPGPEAVAEGRFGQTRTEEAAGETPGEGRACGEARRVLPQGSEGPRPADALTVDTHSEPCARGFQHPVAARARLQEALWMPPQRTGRVPARGPEVLTTAL